MAEPDDLTATAAMAQEELLKTRLPAQI